MIENTIDNYKDNTSGSDRSNNTNTNPAPAKPVDNDTIEIPKVEEKPAKKPVRVYLAYYGAPNENTAAVLDNLHDAGRQAAFFLPTDTSNGTMIWFAESQRKDIRQPFCCRRTAKPQEQTCWRILLLRTNA